MANSERRAAVKSFLRKPAVHLGAGTILIGAAAGLVVGYATLPHASVTVSDEQIALAPDGGIEDSFTVNITDSGPAPIPSPVMGMRRDSRLVSSCRGSRPLTQAQVDQLSGKRRIAPVGPGIDFPTTQPEASWFVALPEKLLAPGETEHCRITYEYQGEPDRAHLIVWTGITDDDSPVLSAGEKQWAEPYPPVTINASARQERYRDPDSPDAVEVVTLQIDQPGAAEYEMSVKRDGLPDAQFDLNCDGQAVTTTSGTTGYLALDGPTTCELYYTRGQKATQAHVELRFLATERQPTVLGRPSWREL